MLKPSDFTCWQYWVLYEWRGWNPYRLYHKLRRFVTVVWAYRQVLWHDQDWDWVFLLALMQLKLSRMGRCFEEHGVLVDSKRMARECRVAAALCQRLIDDDYLQGPVTRAAVVKEAARREADVAYLTHLMRRKLLCWWD